MRAFQLWIVSPRPGLMLNDHAHDRTLVLGATGKTGRRIVRAPAAARRAVRPARARATRLRLERPRRPGRRRSPASTPPTSPTTPTSPSRAPPRRSARSPRSRPRAGVQRLVLLSGRGEPEAQRAEERVARRRRRVDRRALLAGSRRTSARASCRGRAATGEVALPAGDVPRAVRRRRGHRRRRVAALTEDGHAGQVYELTGPRR